MVVHDFTSVSEIIENIYLRAGIQQIPWAQAMSYIQRVIGLLGIRQMYIDRVTDGTDSDPIVIEDYRGVLPKDMVIPGPCREFESKQAMLYGFGNFNPKKQGIVYNTSSDEGSNLEVSLGDLDDPVLRAKYFNFLSDYEQAVFQTLQDKQTQRIVDDLHYKIQGGYMFTDFETGLVEMAYKAYPIDMNGLPMIPDNEKIKRAVEDYIICQLDTLNWRKDPTPRRSAIKADSEQKMAWSIKSAKSHANIPSMEEMESFKRMWLRIIPEVNRFDNNFNNLNRQERFNAKGNR